MGEKYPSNTENTGVWKVGKGRCGVAGHVTPDPNPDGKVTPAEALAIVRGLHGAKLGRGVKDGSVETFLNAVHGADSIMRKSGHVPRPPDSTPMDVHGEIARIKASIAMRNAAGAAAKDGEAKAA